jgi:hypothetical protein
MYEVCLISSWHPARRSRRRHLSAAVRIFCKLVVIDVADPLVGTMAPTNTAFAHLGRP